MTEKNQKNAFLYFKVRASRSINEKIKFKSGIESFLLKNKFVQDEFEKSKNEKSVSLFSEFLLYLNLKSTFTGGFRVEYSDLSKQLDIVPRLRFSYEILKNHILTLDAGIYKQRHEIQYYLFYQTENPKNQQTINTTLSYMGKIKNRTVSVYVYQKYYSQLPQTEETSNTFKTQGTGKATGFDLFFRDTETFRGIEYWLSYSFIDSKRHFLDYPISAQPTFVAKHTGTFVIKKYFPKPSLLITASYIYTSGRPYYNPGKNQDQFLSDYTPDYQTLNINIIYLTKIYSAFTTVVLTVSNILGYDNIFGYKYSDQNTQIRQEITPLYKRFLFLGVFCNFGIDNRKTIINDNF
jgi:hypothetical protein